MKHIKAQVELPVGLKANWSEIARGSTENGSLHRDLYEAQGGSSHYKLDSQVKSTSSSAVAERPRSASCH